MQTTYDANLKATLTVDDDGEIRGIKYVDEYPESEHRNGLDAVAAYVSEIAEKLNIAREELRGINERVSYLDPQVRQVEYRLSEEKTQFDTTTYAYYQTYLNTPVWAAGITATLKHSPLRVLSATNTSARGVDAQMPSGEAIKRYQSLFLTGEKLDGRKRSDVKDAHDRAADSSRQLLEILRDLVSNNLNALETPPTLIRGRFFIYRYDPAKRTADSEDQRSSDQPPARQPLGGPTPTLPLPPVPETIKPRSWYVVAELLIRLPYFGTPMNWRMLVEVETNAILYLRALTANVNGTVFPADPITITGDNANLPTANSATLNLVTDSLPLLGLTAPAPGAEQALEGNFIEISDFELATAAPPTEAAGTDFDYDARTNDFAAVNAYYNCDRFFRLVESLGFPVSSYFDGTGFPVPVDHRGRYLSADGIEVNASCNGDGDGIANVDFELADVTDTTNPIGMACDWRVVLHELGGHGILHDHVNTANFGFSHSAGDSFAVVLNDPNTQATDRFESFPWIPLSDRRHDRAVADGWGWGGTKDFGNVGYNAEQILSTTMFRFYRSIGGDSDSLARRGFAARCTAYLMLRAVSTLMPMSNPASAGQFLDALLTADDGNWDSEGLYGGAYSKVLTWSFEKQNLNAGAPPAVDVYIDDGRAGEYQFLPVHWATTTIWNRRFDEGAAPGLDHEEPALGVVNFAYVKIKNRGASIANNVIVKGYHCKPSAGVVWPTDFDPFTTAEIAVGTLQPNNSEEKIVGPFQWTPIENAWGHDCMLMIVSATGDSSNVDTFTAGEFIEDWRLVPNDNNVAQRNVVLAAGGSLLGFIAGMQDKGFWVGNPGIAAATIKASIALPRFLESRGWRIDLRGLPKEGIRLKSHEQKLLTFDVHRGEAFTKEDVRAESAPDIVVTATADGAPLGGMTYRIDPDLEMPYNDSRSGTKPGGLRACLKKFNWFRLLLGAFIAALICFLTDGFFHERVVAADWTAVFAALGATPPVETPASLLYFAIYEVGRGFLAMIVYVLMRCCCKPGPKTAVIAGIIVWLAFSVTGPAQFIPLGFFSHALWFKVGGFHLVTSIIATIAGAAVYKEGK